MVEPPAAQVSSPHGLRGDYSRAASDYTVAQDWEHYSPQDHALWSTLYQRQLALVERYAASEFLEGTRLLGAAASRIPRFESINERLEAASGWRIVAVPGLIPDQQFFDHLAARRFPVTVWIRRPEELDYLVEPDVFHDFFGHVPLLTNPVFARFMQAYGQAGAKALAIPGGLPMLSRLYWYMVEFGLIRERTGLAVYGAGILSSKGETLYSIESPEPQRLRFELTRVMRTDYRIDSYQHTYFVLESYQELFDACYGTDFTPLYERFGAAPPIPADAHVPGDRPVPRAAPAAVPGQTAPPV
ncbi:MAG TPA: phenylalanine 4-monooxygenase [Steroidobacteraceae bacterium]|jgi:phenylalanine-4-hydroxylase|nr:phenylalanine 4-monooxygenase [Steroidobacteraceae bacterium]